MGELAGISVGNSLIMEFRKVKPTARYRQQVISNMDQLREAMALVLKGKLGLFKTDPNRRFVTFGSCFAENIAEALQEKGAYVYATRLVEDVNCPLNNELLLRRIFLGERSTYTDTIGSRTGADFDLLKDEFIAATDIIFTLGNVFHFPEQRVGCKQSSLERESYEETVIHIREIIALLKAHTTANLFVSVSPIPISGYRGAEFASAIEADCSSKSQLMSALREVKGFTYIPTFEIFRWLPAHQAFTTFGDGANHARHIDRKQIALVMELLC